MVKTNEKILPHDYPTQKRLDRRNTKRIHKHTARLSARWLGVCCGVWISREGKIKGAKMKSYIGSLLEAQRTIKSMPLSEVPTNSLYILFDDSIKRMAFLSANIHNATHEKLYKRAKAETIKFGTELKRRDLLKKICRRYIYPISGVSLDGWLCSNVCGAHKKQINKEQGI